MHVRRPSSHDLNWLRALPAWHTRTVQYIPLCAATTTQNHSEGEYHSTSEGGVFTCTDILGLQMLELTVDIEAVLKRRHGCNLVKLQSFTEDDFIYVMSCEAVGMLRCARHSFDVPYPTFSRGACLVRGVLSCNPSVLLTS
jgi:hypothetical protein